jgi:uncharacterized protein with von Willebrand factor type A (vWA) domain
MEAPGPLLRSVDRAAFAVGLGERLRRAGVPVTFTALGAFTEALGLSPPTEMSALYWAARVTLVDDVVHLAAFDAVFEAVFRDSARPREGQASGPRADHVDDVLASLSSAPAETSEGLPWHTLPHVFGTDDGSPADDVTRGMPELLPSALESLADTPFDELDAEHLAQIGAWLERAWLRWPTRPSRRRRVHPSGRAVALRETIAASRRTGWEALELSRTWGVLRPRPLTLVVDVSQSMQPYAAAYLHLMRALARTGRAETFAFSTSLTRLTPALRHRSATVAMQRATDQVVDRYGGTHLATSLAGLLASRHGNALRGGVLVVASDGWDSDDPAMLVRTLARIRLRAHRIVWLNPRAAAPGFEPRVGSMAAALPFCDAFLPAHTARAMREAWEVLLDARPSSRA